MAYELTPTRVIFQLSVRDGTISMAERVILNSSGNSQFLRKENHSLLKRAMALLLLKPSQVPLACTHLVQLVKAADRITLQHYHNEWGPGEITLSVSPQTLSKGGEGSLSGPQQYVAVQRPALPLQEGKL